MANINHTPTTAIRSPIVAENGSEELTELHIAIENSMTGVSRLDRDGYFVEVRDGYARMLGYRPEELVGQSWKVTVATEDLELGRGTYNAMLNDGRAEGEIRGLKKDGSLFHKQVLLVKTVDPDGQRNGHYCFMRDISERKEAEKKILQYEKFESIGSLASGIAHDLNNLLTPIMGFSELAARSDDPDLTRKALNEINDACAKARDLIAQIHEFSGARAAEPKPMHLAPIVNESLKLVRASLPSNISVEQAFDCKRDLVVTDAARFQQVLINLCSNAGYAMRKYGGRLTVTLTDHDADHLRLRVIDTGKGMSAETLQRLFEPYFTTKEKGEGTGLGLPIVQRVVTDMGGYVEVRSVPHSGSEFDIVLPLAEDAEATAATNDATSDARNLPVNANVMLIDDEPAILEFAKLALARNGHTSSTFGSAKDALRTLIDAPTSIDVVCVDQTMPEMTGIEFISALRRAGQKHPVILMSGHAQNVTEMELTELNVSARLAKPFTVGELHACLKGLHSLT